MQKTSEIDSVAELEKQIMEYLAKQGYEVTRSAKLLGQSGIEHTFNLLARLDDGFADYTIAVCTSTDHDREAQLGAIFNFANKTYDTSIRDRVLIAFSGLDEEAKKLAQRQGIGIIDAEHLETLLSMKAVRPSKVPSTSFKSKAELLEALDNLGYRAEEKARVRGRSGAEYTFDVLAYGDHGLMAHSLGIDIIDNEPVSLETISLFDTKAYDVGIDHKAIFISGGLTLEARQFAQHQRIKILGTVVTVAEVPPTQEPPEAVAEEEEFIEEETKPSESPIRQRIEPEAIQLIPEVMARRYNAIPLTITGNTLQVAMANPTDIFALEAFAAQSRKRIKPVAAASDEVREAIDFNYKAYGEIEKQLSRVSISSEAPDDKLAIGAAVDAPLAQALNLIVEEAAKARASDIHIEPEENRLRIRYRIDGALHDTMSLSMNIQRALISRIKILAGMNIADHYRPQDGQFSIQSQGRQLDIRVATAPTVHGEMGVLRLLDKTVATRGLSDLGFLPDTLATYEKILKTPYGMILVSGPTGAGKTTTLYASINSLDTIGQNIITIEDPAEYRFKDINQIQVNPQAGITFASGLRSVLRLDPDVILVGEIRDGETAGLATQAALTGHLMLSSIHASDTAGVLFRLIDLGVEPFLIASSVIGIIAQRMVRRVCPYCSHLIEAPTMEQMAYQREIKEDKKRFLYGTGCKSCAYTGYLGRTGLFEILVINDAIRMMLSKRTSSSEVREEALKAGMRSMMNDGMRKVKAGITTPAEVLRSAYSTDE